MPTIPEALVRHFLKLARYNRIWVDTVAAQAHLQDRILRPQAYGPPRRVGADVLVTKSRHRGWPVYRITPRQATVTGTVIYAHGGGWVNEIATPHWRLCAQIAAGAGTTVLVPIYPLIPDGTAAEVVGVFAELGVQALAAGPLCLIGDSAGGQIALSAALVLRDRHHGTAALTILISPGLDATLANPEIARVEPSDPWLGQPGIRVFADLWRGSLGLEDPLISPLRGDLRGLGPIILFTGTRDILNPDARLLSTRARAAGVTLDYHEQAGLVHVYPLLPTAAGRSARELIVERIAATLNGRAAAL
jgi:acetyl esterase/lipase